MRPFLYLQRKKRHCIKTFHVNDGHVQHFALTATSVGEAAFSVLNAAVGPIFTAKCLIGYSPNIT